MSAAEPRSKDKTPLVLRWRRSVIRAWQGGEVELELLVLSDYAQSDGALRAASLRAEDRARSWWREEQLAACLMLSPKTFRLRWTRWQKTGWVGATKPANPKLPTERWLLIPVESRPVMDEFSPPARRPVTADLKTPARRPPSRSVSRSVTPSSGLPESRSNSGEEHGVKALPGVLVVRPEREVLNEDSEGEPGDKENVSARTEPDDPWSRARADELSRAAWNRVRARIQSDDDTKKHLASFGKPSVVGSRLTLTYKLVPHLLAAKDLQRELLVAAQATGLVDIELRLEGAVRR